MQLKSRGIAALAFGVTLAASAVPAFADDVTLTLASWRTEDLSVWQDKILPAFEAANPGIKVEFAPINTNDYNAAIQSQMEAGNGPDLITCRPFDVNNDWIRRGYFTKLDGLPGLENFDDTAKAAWSTDGSTYCLPAASVLAGFYYNKDIFNELGLKVPTTTDEFIATLKAIKDNGKYAPLALGTSESWQLAYNGLDSIGPAYWHGEKGRLGLIDGSRKLTDPDFVAAFKAFDDWKPYLPNGYQSIAYADMTQLFTLGKAAILPDGSWNINQVTTTGLNIGVFGPPAVKAGDQRYLQEMPDQGIGISAKSAHPDAAKTFLTWVAGADFQQLYANAAPGFFAMSKLPVKYDDPLATAFAGLKDGAKLTPRLALDRLSAGTPPLDDDTWRVLQQMLNTDETPEQATAELQKGLASWYKPQMGK